MKKILIFGNSDYAKVVTQYLQECYEIVAYVVHRQYLNEKMFLNKPLVAFEDICELYPPHSYQMFVAIGYKQINAIKERIYKSVKESGYKCITYIHSSVRMINGGGGGEYPYFYLFLSAYISKKTVYLILFCCLSTLRCREVIK